jgi:hypothetical protein
VGSGFPGVTPLADGNYVVVSPEWNGGSVLTSHGAVTWGDGTSGVSGAISADNSLVGGNPGDQIGSSGVTALSNGNYVVGSRFWNSYRGAATWGDGASGVTGFVSSANSLVGSNPGIPLTNTGDQVGSQTTALTNGNYVVTSAIDGRGAVTWGDGAAGTTGVVSDANSLVGSNPNDAVGLYVTPLSNGNYVVQSLTWNGNRGAITWADGTTGISGIVSAANSLVGSNYNDMINIYSGRFSPVVLVLSNGNYLVSLPNWNGRRGAVTWGDGTAGTSGVISAANSLVGSNSDDLVGSNQYGTSLTTPLPNGDYLVVSSNWNGLRGAVTWVNGATGHTLDGRGVVTAQNSLVGRTPIAFFPLGTVVPDSAQQSFVTTFASEGTGRVTVGLTDPSQFTYARGQAATVTITPDFLTRTLNTGTAVVLQASNDITVNDPILVDAGGQGGDLTLQAGRSIVLNAGITTDNGALTLIANDTVADGVVNAQRDPGKAFITMAGGTVLDTGQGALDIELRNGAGLTNNASGSINLQALSAGSVSVVNDGPTAASGVRVGTVTTTGPQSYSSPNGVTVVAGDLDAGASAITFTDSVTVAAGVGVGSGSGAVNFVSSDTQTLSSGAGARFSNLSHTGGGTLRLAGDLTVTGNLIQSAGTFDAADQSVTVGRQAVITGGVWLAGTGVQTFAGGLVVADGVFTSSTGPMTVVGQVLQTGGAFGGDGTVDALTVVRGTVVPGTGVLTVAGAVSFDALTSFDAILNSADPAGGYSQLVAGGPVDLGGSTLVLTLGYTPQVGDSFTLVTTSDPNGISGTFAGLGEGATFSQGGLVFQIMYQGGADGKSVVVMRVA